MRVSKRQENNAKQDKNRRESERKILTDLIKNQSQFQSIHVCEESCQNILIIYASGSIGGNENLVIQKGALKENISKNFYLCDSEKTLQDFPNFQKLISPIQENGTRIIYDILELEQIKASINTQLSEIYRIANIILYNYEKYDSFIVLLGFDTICFVSSALSFIFENLSKLVICSGGYLPIKKMRNDSVNNLIESFAVISQGWFLNQVVIVLKNHGYRANRCVKVKDGAFLAISSPNLEPLCSIKVKLRLRSYLFQPKPCGDFSIFQDMCQNVKVLKYHIYLTPQALEYELANPYVKGFVIESYSSANLPEKQNILNIFKKAHEDRGVIFVNIPQSMISKNESIMQKYLEDFHIYYGGDMTCEAALAKLSYLLGKGYSTAQIEKLIQTNLRGELTEQKYQNQYQLEKTSFMKLVEEVLEDHYPSTFLKDFTQKLQNRISAYITPNVGEKSFDDIFWSFNHHNPKMNFEEEVRKLVSLINQNNLLHLAVKSKNYELTKYFLKIGAEVNHQDKQGKTPAFYALSLEEKQLIQILSRAGGRVICPLDHLLQILIEALKKDKLDFFTLLYHMEFKQTLKQIVNEEARNIGHLACLLSATKCSKYLKEKFKVNFKTPDNYGFTAERYQEERSKKKHQFKGK